MTDLFGKNLEKWVNPVPTYYAAIRLARPIYCAAQP